MLKWNTLINLPHQPNLTASLTDRIFNIIKNVNGITAKSFLMLIIFQDYDILLYYK